MKQLLGLALLLSLALTACDSAEPEILSGREWNSAKQVVADTTSSFAYSDPFIVQFNYGKAFDFDSLKIEFFDGAGKTRFRQTVEAKHRTGSYTVVGKKKGELMTAEGYFHSKKAQEVTVKFTALVSNKDATIEKLSLEKKLAIRAEK